MFFAGYAGDAVFSVISIMGFGTMPQRYPEKITFQITFRFWYSSHDET